MGERSQRGISSQNAPKRRGNPCPYVRFPPFSWNRFSVGERGAVGGEHGQGFLSPKTADTKTRNPCPYGMHLNAWCFQMLRDGSSLNAIKRATNPVCKRTPTQPGVRK